jgi:uncharacterized protein YsxB (DUF464 family)
MIRIVAELRPGIFRLDVDGHEERAAGGVVCAAVTAITNTALLGLAEIARQHPDLVSVEITEE